MASMGRAHRYQHRLFIHLEGTAVFFLTVFTAIHFLLFIGKNKNMGKSLLDRGDAPGVFAADDIFNLFGKKKLLLGDDLPILDHIDGNIMINEGKNIQV